MFVFCVGSTDRKKRKLQDNQYKDTSTDEEHTARECRKKNPAEDIHICR